MFPLYLWLPNAYSKTTAPVAALFAIMTKVGIYSIIRVHGTLFGETAGELAFYHIPWVLNIGLFTLLLATLGVMAAKQIRSLVAYLVLASVSVLLVATGINTSEALSGTIYYMIHSTFIAGGFFLLADILVTQRGGVDSIETKTAAFQRSILTGGIFFIFAMGAAGLPPLSGFFGKVMILSSAIENPEMALIFTMLIVSSVLIVISLARAGSSIFYDIDREKEVIPYTLNKSALTAVLFLFLFSPLMVIFANPITEFLDMLGVELMRTTSYIEAVLNITVEVTK